MATLVTTAGREKNWAPSGPQAWPGAQSILALVGNTPLLRLECVVRDYPGVELYAKAEWANPGGSIKDRTALNIVREAERAGLMNRDTILLDSTSGNTGIAYAMICAARGYRLRLCVPGNVSEERKRILEAYGATIDYTDPMEGSDGALRRARELFAANPDVYFYANQYNNPANWQAHYATTGQEIIAQTGGRLTHFIAGLGTSGTFVGTSRRLKEANPAIQCISLQPDSAFNGLEGLKYMPAAIQPGIYDPELADQNLWIGTEETHAMARRLAREEGLLVGISSAAAAVAALRIAERGGPSVIVTIFPDSGNRYLSERFWNDQSNRGDRLGH
jgi:S-sulfo-L-cysteine synthase (O-acetyl-L-serine-dependent)